MMTRKCAGLLPALLCALAAGCGGGGGGGASAGSDVAAGAEACGVLAQKQWVLDTARTWYLFPETLPASVNTASYSSAQGLLDELTRTARAQGRDRYWSYLTTKATDQALFRDGEYIGYGFFLQWQGRSVEEARLFVRWSFEGSPAARAGLSRGAEITAIDDGSGFRSVRTIAAGGSAAFAAAMGADEVGVRRGFRWTTSSTQQQAYVTQDIVSIVPVPGGGAVVPRPGAPGVGYLPLISFVQTANAPLREAFEQFRQQGISDFIIDLRYNGGGLLSVTQLLGDLLGAGRSRSDVFARIEFNPQHADRNSDVFFTPQPESVAPLRIAFITTGNSASASEAIVNQMKPYAQVAIIGSDTYGKPVGQMGLVLDGCDTVLRLIASSIENSQGEGGYFQGLAETLPGAACAADDDLGRMPGDGAEASTQAALSWLATGSCSTPMSANAAKIGSASPWTQALGEAPGSVVRETLPGAY